MFKTFIQAMLLSVMAYAVAGVIFTVAFQIAGLRRLDHGARGAGWLFRLLITPGVIALWPLLLGKWRHAARGDEFVVDAERPLSARQIRSWHRWGWKLLAVTLPFLLSAALFSRPEPSRSIVPKLPAAKTQPRRRS